jgi:hypothetical protein
MNAQAVKQHQWLHRLVGEWTYEHEVCMKPGDPPHRSAGRETVRLVGDLWIVAEAEFTMAGCAGTTIMTLGYDPQRQRYVGTWVGSMMTHLWLYNGSLDPSEKVLTLDTEGPAMSGEGTAKYQDIIEFAGDDVRLFRSRLLGDSGDWQEFLTGTYQRRA